MKRWNHHRADEVKVDTDEGRFVLLITTEDDDLSIDIHDDVLAFYQRVREEIGPYAAEAENARSAVARGVSREEYLRDEYAHMRQRGEFADDEDDSGYALDDPKHPTYYERMVD